MTESSNIHVRKPNIEDLPNLIELWHGQYDYHHELDSTYYAPSSEELDKKFDKYLEQAIEKNDPYILVAEIEHKIIGFITFEKKDADYFDTNIVEHGDVLELFVVSEYRKKGVGKKLMDEAEKIFQKNGVKFMSLQCSTQNNNALDFYKKSGFIGRQSILYKEI